MTLARSDVDGPEQRLVLGEIARQMKRGWELRDHVGDKEFKAAHQLAHWGWKFGGSVIDSADGTGVPSIKGLRALMVAGRHVWFEHAAELAPGSPETAASISNELERQYLARLCGPHTPLSRFSLDEAEIWMVLESAGWRVAAVYIRDASASGLKDILHLASVARGGCLSVVAGSMAVVGFTAFLAGMIAVGLH